ncbi:OprO/OprP family phosphate-selective porin [Marinigracilibium pacificum]|uniref:Porin n=1 Tax=Marinigracilibium pacificum TaxID=2729599 RepID=A0A848J117_9BACT|nr:porin [Marinigracilibium pacificum]NMM48240.1 porin [Marinigracilibium pacificum]
MSKKLAWLAAFFISLVSITAQEQDTTITIVKDSVVVIEKKSDVKPLSYGKNGFEMRSQDNKFSMNIRARLQFRFATPEDQDPLTFNDLSGELKPVFKINRARLKVGGHGYKPWLKYYFEYELATSRLLDFRIMIEKYPWLKFKFGQWKVEFTRERFISSGAQTMVDRSIINRPFTADRQQGAQVYGNTNHKGALNFDYWFGMFAGTGRGARENDDNNLMYFGRLQWNPFGEAVDFKGSDLKNVTKPQASLAVALLNNTSPYTRFSTGGGGSLLGFEDGEPGQYKTDQINYETAFKYKGFAWQSEYHRKRITDRLNNDAESFMEGYYLQASYFLHNAISWFPEPLEIATRYAKFDPYENLPGESMEEYGLALNWFFSGHNNKLSAEITDFSYKNEFEERKDQLRFRIQWDISF